MLISSFRSMSVFIGVLVISALACAGLSSTTQEVEPPLAATPPLVDKSAEWQEVDRAYCDSAEVHPIGASIAATFEIAYEEVMGLYCDGHAFEEVLLALETQAQSQVAAETILQMRDDGLSWDEIWLELGLTE